MCSSSYRYLQYRYILDCLCTASLIKGLLLKIMLLTVTNNFVIGKKSFTLFCFEEDSKMISLFGSLA